MQQPMSRTHIPQSHLCPGARKKNFAMLLAGGAAAAFGLWRRGPIGWPMVVGGSLLVTRAVMNGTPRELTFDVSRTINRSRADVYEFISDFNRWPLFMKDVESAHLGEENTVVWKSALNGREGQCKILQNHPQQLLRWITSIDGQSHESIVEFKDAPGNRGTEVHWHVRMRNPLNAIAQLFRSAIGDSEEQFARESLRRFKQLLETGEVPTTDGQPHGKRGLTGKTQRAMLRESVDEDTKRPSRHADLPTEQIIAS